MNCPVCTKELEGKKSYCSGACKMKASRNRNNEPSQSVTKEDTTVTNVTLATVTEPTVTLNSKGHPIPQTQEEIEAYYTKENFPSLSYGTSNSPNPPHVRGSRANAV